MAVHTFKSIITLIVFLLTNLVVVFPFSIPIYVPPSWLAKIRPALIKLRILPIGANSPYDESGEERRPISFCFPLNFVTTPVISVLFLLCLHAIGRKEVHDGILGADNIIPIDIMAFFLTLAYLAISLDATGLIRFLAFWVLQKGGKVGHRLYLLLYVFFFALGSFIGNDPIILSGTAFLAYLTRVASNIKNPRAWIYAQFAVANISSAILVSSNPTNLVLSGAFQLSFVKYTLNMIVPAVITGAVLFPFLLYIIFPSTDLIPYQIDLHAIREEPQPPPSNEPMSMEEERRLERQRQKQQELKEIMDPFLDKKGALFGGVLLTITLTTLLVTNAANLHPGVWTMTVPAGAIMFIRDAIFDWRNRATTRRIARAKRIEKAEKTRRRKREREAERRRARQLAAAVLSPRENHVQSPTEMTEAERPIAERGRNMLGLNAVDDEKAAVEALADRLDVNTHPFAQGLADESFVMTGELGSPNPLHSSPTDLEAGPSPTTLKDLSTLSHRHHRSHGHARTETKDTIKTTETSSSIPQVSASPEQIKRSMSGGTIGEHPPALLTPSVRTQGLSPIDTDLEHSQITSSPPSSNVSSISLHDTVAHEPEMTMHENPVKGNQANSHADPASAPSAKKTTHSLYGAWRRARRYAKETFPTVCAVIEHLPFALLPFAFSMFILVQGLVTKGWVELFANGWNAWVTKTGTVGAIGGMGFVSVLLCNFAGTNIGATILLSRVLQTWFHTHAITERTRDASIYALALGVNYGAFSAAFNASLAGLLWRDILKRKHIEVRRLDFARINLPIIAIAMSVGCGVLTAQVYMFKGNVPELKKGV